MDHAFANYDAEQGDLADASSSGDLDRLLELLEGADALLAANADVHASDEVKRSGTTALVVASRTGHHTCVLSLLAAGAEVDKAEVFGTTSLTAATKNGHLACVQVLLEAGANVHASRGDDAPTPIGLGTHELFPSRARERAVRLLLAGHLLARSGHGGTALLDGHYLNVAKGAPAVPACDTSPDRSIPGPRKRERERATAERRMRRRQLDPSLSMRDGWRGVLGAKLGDVGDFLSSLVLLLVSKYSLVLLLVS
ncbi:hypothetical protein T492DRAFT_913125 [Pavlovales sp. CCMP2436]|nr:hypothetical protein T492DRAFT_913125 [Pavlovales sp. CCMP2436]